MSCVADIDLSGPEYMQGVVEKARRLRVPLSGYFDLTHRCNFRCLHCYAGHLVAQPRGQAGELATEEFSDVLRGAVESGCLFVVFSGGEPLLREDFTDLYTTARRLGLIVSVFTNGSLVGERHVALFEEYPPHKVEVSVYGANEETYRRVVGVTGTFDRVRTGIDRLLGAGIRVCLKSMILKENADDIPAIERMAVEYGVDFMADPLVLPRLDGGPQSTRERLEPGRAVRIEKGLESRRADLRKFIELEKAGLESVTESPDRLYQCGAGLVSFHLDPQGLMRPCLFSRRMQYNVRELGFAEAWRETVSSVDSALWTGAEGCRACPDRFLCGYCVAVFELEQASPTKPPRYACELGKGRRRVLDEAKAEAGLVKTG